MLAKCLLFLAAADKHYAMVSFLLPAHLQSRDFLAGSLFFFFVSVEQWNSCNCGERDGLIWNIPPNWNQCTPQRSVSTSLSPCIWFPLTVCVRACVCICVCLALSQPVKLLSTFFLISVLPSPSVLLTFTQKANPKSCFPTQVFHHI